MAMTEAPLLFLGTLATLASVGMFVEFGDEATHIIISFAAALLWAVFGISAWDVSYMDSGVTTSVALTPLVYLGLAFAGLIAVFTFYEIVTTAGAQIDATDADGLIR